MRAPLLKEDEILVVVVEAALLDVEVVVRVEVVVVGEVVVVDVVEVVVRVEVVVVVLDAVITWTLTSSTRKLVVLLPTRVQVLRK